MSSAFSYQPHYTVKDYHQWEGEWELWYGTAISMAPSPFGRHSKLLVKMATALEFGIQKSRCDATVLAEIDWIVSSDTVLRPDVLVVCGVEPEKHVEETPSLVVEILSEGTRDRDLNYKRTMYEEQGVPFYLIVDPEKDELLPLQLNQEGVYFKKEYTNILQVNICDDCQLEIDVDRIFGRV